MMIQEDKKEVISKKYVVTIDYLPTNTLSLQEEDQ